MTENHTPRLSLVVMAAGMGSRYGGLKQLEGVGPTGETILEYSVFDALRAGFEEVVFVIRKDIEPIFKETVLSRFPSEVVVKIVYQEINALPFGWTAPSSRSKPWGTGHAVLVAKQAVNCPFAVINADDFYGANAYQQLATFLLNSNKDSEYALAAYPLANTLSAHGTVARGICTAEGSRLLSIHETKDIGCENNIFRAGDKVFTGKEFVSMNLWGFKPSVFSLLERDFTDFLKDNAEDAKAEFYLPACISQAIAAQEVEVSIVPVHDKWYGVTYKEDRPEVVQAIQNAISQGIYPSKLW